MMKDKNNNHKVYVGLEDGGAYWQTCQTYQCFKSICLRLAPLSVCVLMNQLTRR